MRLEPVDKRKPRSKPGSKPGAGSAAPWPDEGGTRSRSGGDKLPPGWELTEVTGSPIYGATFAASFVRATVTDPGGREHKVILRRLKPESTGSIIWEGDIRILGRYSTYRISSGRVLKSPDWSDYLIVESVNRMGISSAPVPIAAMDLKQTQPKAFWLDQLKVTLSGRVSQIAEFIRLSGEEWDKPSSLMIRGQGPVWLRDGSPLPNKLLDHSLVFISRSGVFDTAGEYRNVIPDLSQIPETYSYYDLTPVSLITREDVSHGIECFREAYSECPNFPAIPAAFLGQLFTGFAVAIKPQFFTAILQTGIKGSGKTRYAARWDAIQSRESERTRGDDLRGVKPVLNLGDNTGTLKGPKYRMAEFGGYSITVDDVLKDGNSPAQRAHGSESVSNLIRSYESGGAAIAGVDYSRNEVGGRESPALHSSIRVLSEISIDGESTLDRMLVMPHIGEPWGRGNIFSVEISSRLSTPDAIEAMHRAYSAYVVWAFQRIEDMEDVYSKALAETNSWEIDSRHAERYAAAVAGHYMFARFCESEYGIDITGEIRGAIDALAECAKTQAMASVPLAERFAADLRSAIMRGRIAFPGAPAVSPDGIAASYGLPWIMGEPTDDNGVRQENRIMPTGISIPNVGMMMTGDGKPTINPRAIIGGFSLPPRDAEKTGGHARHELTRGWHIAIRKEQFDEVIRIVSESSSRAYDSKAVMDSLRSTGYGDYAKIRVNGPKAPQERVRIIDLIWALKSRED